MGRDPLAGPQAVAAFDLDGTLTEGGSVVSWLRAVAGRRVVTQAVVRHGPSLLAGAVRSGSTADDAKERLFTSVLAGRSLDRVVEVSDRFAREHLHLKVRRQVAARLTAHLEAGHTVVIVSASPALYVRQIALDLGVAGSVSTELEVDEGGNLTGRYDGKNCRGEEKLRRVRELLDELGVGDTGPELPLYAYGNSRGDLRLLGSADRPVDVSKLGRLGRLSRFPRLEAQPLT
jgi:phosphatidylglycerophosphatase C